VFLSSQFFDLDTGNPLGRGALAKFEPSMYFFFNSDFGWIQILSSYPRKKENRPFFGNLWKIKAAQRQAPFVRWSAIWVGFYPLGRQFCSLGAVFQRTKAAAFFDLFSCVVRRGPARYWYPRGLKFQLLSRHPIEGGSKRGNFQRVGVSGPESPQGPLQ
jgi:hypothetical protein